ncbi:hypothetical protein Taro_001109 [Colocasia esculenta]|uniref:Uncharacterized protein n=1 Tax=Colocasia esculenta TaxID=4460 RepID=A0A843TH29_COLES|nr:hypothetical protein [Colocasia esculenta]
MERHKSILQPFFPCFIRTPKTHRCLNTLYPNPRDEFRTCWGHVEELLVAGEIWINHKKLIFFRRSSATTCTNRSLEVDQSRVEELLVAGELWINNKKLIFLPRSSATTCTNRPLEVHQRAEELCPAVGEVAAASPTHFLGFGGSCGMGIHARSVSGAWVRR